MRCDFCHDLIPADRRADSRFCSSPHRFAWHRAQDRRRRELLMAQTRAIIGGDAAALAAIVAEVRASGLFR